jgi:hypothetical protein
MTEGRVADTILEKPFEVNIGGVTYKVAPPSLETLIVVSEEVAKIPQYDVDKSEIVSESLRVAKDARPMGDILAILILGAGKLKSTRMEPEKTFLGRVTKWRQIEVDNVAELSEIIRKKLTPSRVNNLTNKILGKMEMGFFLGSFIFLREINLTKPTRMIPSGE